MNKLIGAAVAAVAVLWGAAADAQTYPKMKMRLGHFLPATFAEADVDQWFADEVKKRSGGNIEIEIFWAGSLGGPKELLGLVSSGAVEFAAFPFLYYTNELPLHAAGTLPRVYNDAQSAYQNMLKLFQTKALIAEQKKNNIKAVTGHNSNPYRIACNGPVGSIDEMKGYRVRSVGEYFPVLFNEVGMVPVDTPANEVYEGLDRGTLNCAFLSYDQMISSKIYEVAKHASDINLGALSTWQIWINQDKYDSLPPEVQTLIMEVGEEAAKRDADAVGKKLDGLEEQLAKNGMTLTPLKDMDDFNKRMPSAVQLWSDKMKSLGFSAEIDEITAIVGPMEKTFK